MLRLEHLKIFYRYNGDIDSWARSGSKKENEIMTDEYWSMINNFQQDLELIRKGITSKEFEMKIMDDLKKVADSETQEHLLENKKPKSNSLY